MKWLLFISAILSMTVLSFADKAVGDWNFYGSVRLNAAQWQRGHWYRYPLDTSGAMDTTSDDYDYDTLPIERFMYDMQFNSRFGALFKGEKLGFRFEAGWGYMLRDYKAKLEGVDLHTSQRVKDALTLRRLYGEWFINDYFTLLIGHEWNIANFLTTLRFLTWNRVYAIAELFVPAENPRSDSPIITLKSQLTGKPNLPWLKPILSLPGHKRTGPRKRKN